MQLSSDVKEIHRTYEYAPRGRRWAVCLRITYRQGDCFPPRIFSIGEKVGEYPTREEARREVYRRNGWKYRERRTT